MEELKRGLLRRERDTGERSLEARRHFNALKRKRSLGSVWTHPHLFRLRQLLGAPPAPAAGGGWSWWGRARPAPRPARPAKLSIWSKLQLDTAERLRYVVRRCFAGATPFQGVVLPYYTPGHVSMLYIDKKLVCYLFDSNGKEYAKKIITEHRLHREWNTALGTEAKQVHPLGMSVGIMQRWQSDSIIDAYLSLETSRDHLELMAELARKVTRDFAPGREPKSMVHYIMQNLGDSEIQGHLRTLALRGARASRVVHELVGFHNSVLVPFLQRLPREGFEGICAAANYWFFSEWVRSRDQQQLSVQQLEDRVVRGFCDIRELKTFMQGIRAYLDVHFEPTMTEILQSDIDKAFLERHHLTSLSIRVCVGTHKFAATVDAQGVIHANSHDSDPCVNDKPVIPVSTTGISDSPVLNAIHETERHIKEIQNMYYEDGVGSSATSVAVTPTTRVVAHTATEAERYTCNGSVFDIPGPGTFHLSCSTLDDGEIDATTKSLQQVLEARSSQPLVDHLIRDRSTRICGPHLYVESDMRPSLFG